MHRFSQFIGRISLAAVILLWLPSCNGLDDDSEFDYGTQASIFQYHDPLGGAFELAQLRSGQLDLNWGTGIAGGKINAFTLDREQVGWLWREASPGGLMQFDEGLTSLELRLPASGSRTYQYLAAGDKYVAGVDTLSDSLFFMPRKKGDTFYTSFGNEAGPILYNGGKFYLKKGCCSIGIINETALAEYAVADAELEILSMELDEDRNVFLILSDSVDLFGQRINANADILTNSPTPIGFDRVEFTPWLNQIYGDELIGNVFLRGLAVELSDRSSGTRIVSVISDSAQAFSTDFFEGQVFHTWNDSLYGTDIGPDTALGTWYFPYSLEAGYHFLGREEM